MDLKVGEKMGIVFYLSWDLLGYTIIWLVVDLPL